jgi:hypothetical protein
VQAITVDPGPASVINLAFVSVTICAPGSTTSCQTIDHIQLDTGSSGLRILSSVLTSSVSLPQQTDASGNPIVECMQFADGFSWGPVKLADVKIAGEQASAIPIHIIGDPQFPTVPSACSSVGPAENTVQAFGANGILGVGLFQQDCGSFCTTNTSAGLYYVCPPSGCHASVASLAQQPPNPVAMFSADNNGVLIQMPSLPAVGAATASGSLIFGIGTQTNNGLGTATVFTVNPNTGFFTTTYKGLALSKSFIDSGSNGFFLPDPGIPICSSGFYCPNATLNLSATNQGANGATGTVNFNLANADSLHTNNPTFAAFANLGGPTFSNFSSSFDWGLAFFYGRNVFTAIENRSTSGGNGPYFAY